MSLVINKYWTSLEKYNIVNNITFTMMKEYCENVVKNLYLHALVQGNVTAETTTNSVQNFIKILNYGNLDVQQRRQVVLKDLKI